MQTGKMALQNDMQQFGTLNVVRLPFLNISRLNDPFIQKNQAPAAI